MFFHHVGFVTPSLEASVNFWVEAFGFEVKSRLERGGEWIEGFTGLSGAKLRLAFLEGQGLMLEFVEFAQGGAGGAALPGNQNGVGHICIKTHALEETLAAVLAAGGRVCGAGITTMTEGASAGTRGTYVSDPGGLLIELVELRPAA